jgi:uncharacterized phage protein (TIGR01671 family)
MNITKFRAWDNIRKRMCYFEPGFSWDDEYNNWYLFTKDFKNTVCDAPFGDNINLMQFIGVLDKNKKEIYEGDILRSNIFPYDLLATVKYLDDRGYFIWFVRKDEKHATWNDFGDFLDEDCWCEVVGNIYQNPELLKEI